MSGDNNSSANEKVSAFHPVEPSTAKSESSFDRTTLVTKEVVPASGKTLASQKHEKVPPEPTESAFTAWENRIRKRGQVQQERAQMLKECSSQWEEELRQGNQRLAENEKKNFTRQWEGDLRQNFIDCENKRRSHDSKTAAWEGLLRDKGSKLHQRYLKPNQGSFNNEQLHCYYPGFNNAGDYCGKSLREDYMKRLEEMKQKGDSIRNHGYRTRDSMLNNGVKLQSLGTSIHQLLINSERPLKEKIQVLYDKGNAIRAKITQRRPMPMLSYSPFSEFGEMDFSNPAFMKDSCQPKLEYRTESDGQKASQFGEINVETFDDNGVQCRSIHAKVHHRSVNTNLQNLGQKMVSQ